MLRDQTDSARSSLPRRERVARAHLFATFLFTTSLFTTSLFTTLLRTALLSTFLLNTTHAGSISQTGQADPGKAFIIAKVSKDPRSHYRNLKPMADYLANQLEEHGYNKGEVILTKDNDQMIAYLREHTADLITGTPYSALKYMDRANFEAIAVNWQEGVSMAHSLIVTRKDSGIHSLTDLSGRTIAFKDPDSTTAYFLPLALLRNNNLEPHQLSNFHQRPPPKAVGFVFSGSEQNSGVWLYNGNIDAIAISNLDWNNPLYFPEKLRRAFKILCRSSPLPMALELVKKDMDGPIKQRLINTLLKMNQDKDTKSIMERYQQTTRFSPINREVLTSIEQLRETIRKVEGL